jgi:hypothetical protein
LTEQEHDWITDAIKSQLKGVVGAKVEVASFLRAVGIREAKKILGIKD